MCVYYAVDTFVLLVDLTVDIAFSVALGSVFIDRASIRDSILLKIFSFGDQGRR